MQVKATSELLRRASEAKRESRYLDFKEKFDPKSEEEWIEIVKDIIAMANSGGGVLVFGVSNNGTPSGADVKPILELDPAKITDKLYRYTNEQFSDFEIHDVKRGRRTVAALVIHGVELPIPFTNAGRYERPSRRPKTVFTAGSIYFRHGAKSAPAMRSDLGDVIERRLDQVREKWVEGVRRVVEAPEGSHVAIYEPTESDEGGVVQRVRLTTEPGAPTFGRISADETHPHRQKELISEVNRRLARGAVVNTHDMQAIRHAHDIDAHTRPEFCHQPRYASAQYSDLFVEWIVEQVETLPDFLRDARKAYRDDLRRRR